MNSAAILIPATTKHRYLGGLAALNLPSLTGTGDWHMEQTFFRPREKRSRSFISGVGCETDTTSMLGEEGVYDCTHVLDDLGIPHASERAYAANHARAIADLVLSAVQRGQSPDFVRLDDWMPRDNEKQQVFDLLAKAAAHLDDEKRQVVIAWETKNQLRQDYLKPFAAKYIWWKTPEEAMLMPERVIAQVMNIGDYADVQALASQLDSVVTRLIYNRAFNPFLKVLELLHPSPRHL